MVDIRTRVMAPSNVISFLFYQKKNQRSRRNVPSVASSANQGLPFDATPNGSSWGLGFDGTSTKNPKTVRKKTAKNGEKKGAKQH